MVVVEPVWLCVRHSGNCREGRASRGRARDVDVPVPQIQELTFEVDKENPQEIDVEKLTDENVDEMILMLWGGGTAQDQDVCKVHGGRSSLFSPEACVCPIHL